MSSLRYAFIDPLEISAYERIGWRRAGLILGGDIGMIWEGHGKPILPCKAPDARRRKMHQIRAQERGGASQ